uniref:Ubiquitin-associated and SH3 domain-containing protein B n=1 Tax=Schistocephalus solidus TaxID=70667 RepID=A0A0X3PQQ9_SCHSO
MASTSSPTITADDSQYKSKAHISKKLRDRLIRVSLKVNSRQRDPAFEYIEKRVNFKEHKKQITKLKSTLEKYWTTLAQLRDLMRSIDETVLAILKPDLDVGELDSIAEQKPDLSRLKEFKKTLLGYSLGQVEDVLKLMQKAEVAQVSETRAGSNIEKAKEAKEEFGRIRKELQTKIPNTEELVQRNITEFASEYLTFVDEDVQVENQYRSTMKNWLSMDALRTTAETNTHQRSATHPRDTP